MIAERSLNHDVYVCVYQSILSKSNKIEVQYEYQMIQARKLFIRSHVNMKRGECLTTDWMVQDKTMKRT